MADHPRLEWNEDDPTTWDAENGTVGIMLVANAIQVWSVFNAGPRSVADAAAAFNMNPSSVIEAVEEHPWMFLTGPRDDFHQLMIEHEGE